MLTLAGWWMFSVGNQQDYRIAADQQRTVADAFAKYLKDNYAVVLTNAGPTAPVQVTVDMMQNTKYLPAGFSSTNSFGQTIVGLARRLNGNQLEAIVVTTGGQAIPELGIRMIAEHLGGPGGFISSLKPGIIQGVRGGWELALSNYGINPGQGHTASALFLMDGDLANDYLYRNAVPGHPEYNRMNTAIDMGGNDINNARAITATSDITSKDGWFRSQNDNGWVNEKWGGGILTHRMIEDGYRPSARGSMAPAAMSFMRDHGVLKDIYTERDGDSHKTAKGKKLSVRTVKAPGFGPKGIHRFVLPFTVFLKLKDIGGNVLPSYQEEFIDVPMAPEQASAYQRLAATLTAELRQALARRDTTLLGVVLNVLLAWPDCCFRSEMVKHPRTRDTLAFVPALFGDHELMPKEQALLNLCLEEKAKGRKVLAYTVYSGTRDTTARLKKVLEHAGLKVAVLRASVDTSRREDWILDQVDRGIDVLITNPELVKTGLDLLDFPTIAFLQTGYNVYTLQQAARRSWRIGQKHPVRVIFFGYAGSSQITCLQLMAKKIAVAQSTSGDVPESGLDALNQDGDSVEMALARQLIAA